MVPTGLVEAGGDRQLLTKMRLAGQSHQHQLIGKSLYPYLSTLAPNELSTQTGFILKRSVPPFHRTYTS